MFKFFEAKDVITFSVLSGFIRVRFGFGLFGGVVFVVALRAFRPHDR